jgi:hypothetical protein
MAGCVSELVFVSARHITGNVVLIWLDVQVQVLVCAHIVLLLTLEEAACTA